MKCCRITLRSVGFLLSFILLLTACTLSNDVRRGNKANDKAQKQQKEQVNEVEGDTAAVIGFAQALKTAKWIDSGDGFKYPDIMYKTEVFVDDIPTTMDLWTWGHIQLTLFYAGNWATFTEDFPVPGCIIVPHTRISEVTYTSENQCIFSGYLDDGRIFYLRRIIISDNVDIPSALILSLSYPKDCQDEVEPLIEVVRRWSIHGQYN